MNSTHRLIAIVMLGVLPMFSLPGQTHTVSGAPATIGFDALGIAVDGRGTVYVSDNTSHRIVKLTRNGTVVPFARFGKTGELGQKGCVGLAVDARNDLYVAGCSRYRLMELSPSGTLIRHWNGSSVFYYPAVTPHGLILATSFDEDTVYRLPVHGGMPSVFNGSVVPNPMGIAVDRAGNVYVALHREDTVVKFSPTGKFLASSRTVARPLNDSFLQGLAVDSRGYVYVSSSPDDTNDQVVRLSPNLQTAKVFLRAGSKLGQVSNPLGLAVDRHDNLYVADNYNGRVQEIAPTGRVAYTWHG